LAFTADRGDCSGQGLVKNFPLEKYQGVQSLSLGGGRYLASSGEMGKKPLYIFGAKPIWMGLATEVTDIAQYPVAIGLLGTVGVVVITEYLAHLVHEPEAGIWAKFRSILLWTFHLMWQDSVTSGIQQEKM
jgi:hypothetical protein